MTLSDEELGRYARHIVLREIGGSGQLRLKGASVAVVGCGGIGSPAIQYLAAAGIGRLILIDDDRVESSNLQRQTIFGSGDIGATKVAAAGAAVRRINPLAQVVARALRITADTAAAAFQDAQIILDGSDNFATRLAVADTAHALRLPLVSAAAGQFDGQLAVYRGWEAGLPCYRCLVGDVADQAGDTCAEQGVLGPVTGTIGSLAALEVIREIVPFGEGLAGRLLIADLVSMRFRNLAVPKDPGCATCGLAPL